MAFVRGLSMRRTLAGLTFHVCGSQSANTGSASTYRTAFAVAMYVRSGMMTSSPALIPSDNSAKWSALVPFVHEIACRVPTKLANSSSNWVTKEPLDEIQDESNALRRAVRSDALRSGADTAMYFRLHTRCSLLILRAFQEDITLPWLSAESIFDLDTPFDLDFPRVLTGQEDFITTRIHRRSHPMLRSQCPQTHFLLCTIIQAAANPIEITASTHR